MQTKERDRVITAYFDPWVPERTISGQQSTVAIPSPHAFVALVSAHMTPFGNGAPLMKSSLVGEAKTLFSIFSVRWDHSFGPFATLGATRQPPLKGPPDVEWRCLWTHIETQWAVYVM
jgi:hypothetical protein